MISFDSVSKTYIKGHKPALSNINFTVNKGEFVFLVGPSGSGKSSLLHLILRDERPEEGTIMVAGFNVNELSNANIPFYRRKLGVVFQGFRLLQQKTVLENISFALEVTRVRKKEIKTRVQSALKLVGLEGKENRMPNELSGGEQQRVAIARAFVNKPLLILADEPTGNLDPQTSLGIMKIFDAINRAGTTVVMSTHNADIVNIMKRRVIELEGGVIKRDEKNAVYSVDGKLDPNVKVNKGVKE